MIMRIMSAETATRCYICGQRIPQGRPYSTDRNESNRARFRHSECKPLDFSAKPCYNISGQAGRHGNDGQAHSA